MGDVIYLHFRGSPQFLAQRMGNRRENEMTVVVNRKEKIIRLEFSQYTTDFVMDREQSEKLLGALAGMLVKMEEK